MDVEGLPEEKAIENLSCLQCIHILSYCRKNQIFMDVSQNACTKQAGWAQKSDLGTF